jgi:hypothetical protein
MQIIVRFLGGLSPSQQAVFTEAANRWENIIMSSFEPVTVEGESIEGLLIEARGLTIDGQGQVLGQAGPTLLRPSMIPVKGVMEFDAADLAALEETGSLLSVILHEMGHVLGIGTLWESKGLLSNNNFTGLNAAREYGSLLLSDALPVPVEDMGGPGTAGGHWRETTFADELMTGFISGATQPLSRLTIASLIDLGYDVSFDEADQFALPSNASPRAVQTAMSRICQRMQRTSPQILPY